MTFSNRISAPICLSLCCAILTAWPFSVLIWGRVLPWQADRWWLFTFAILALVSGYWWLRFFRQVEKLSRCREEWLAAALLGAGLPLVPMVVLLIAVYGSNGLNHLLAMPNWSLPFLMGTSILLVLSGSLRGAALGRLLDPRMKLRDAVLRAAAARSEVMAVGSLLVLGALQAAAGVIPIGDDIWHYTQVADAMLAGSPYPIGTISTALQDAGMARAYPALPLLPLLLAASFSAFGRNLLGVALPNVLATALFPLAMYVACKGLTGSRLTAYAATVLLFLFPVYQIHVLGTAEPDTLFVTLLLMGAFFATRVNRIARTGDLIGMGVFMGLASLTRHEGSAYTAAMFATFILFHPARRRLCISVAAYLAVLAPFVAVYHSVTGSLWPSTFGKSIMGWQYLEANLTTLSWTSQDWYAQAIGVDRNTLVVLIIAIAVCAALGTVALLRQSPPLVGIPAAGLGNLAAGLFMHPLVVYSGFPVDFLRHVSYGIPFAALGLVYAGHVGLGGLSKWLQGMAGNGWRGLLAAILIFLACAGLFYETERLAKPEWYFQGKASLLWTSSYYLLTDIATHPAPLPLEDDPRSGEQIREYATAPVEPMNLRTVNLSEPYHWASLLVALLGLAYAATSPRDTPRPRSHPRGHTAPRTASGPPASP